MSNNVRKPIVIPIGEIQPDTLTRLIEEFITREGTDYGHLMPDLSDKVDKVRKQLSRGQAQIVFDDEEESFTILTQAQLDRI